MICPYCHKEIENDMKFCSWCGKELHEETESLPEIPVSEEKKKHIHLKPEDGKALLEILKNPFVENTCSTMTAVCIYLGTVLSLSLLFHSLMTGIVICLIVTGILYACEYITGPYSFICEKALCNAASVLWAPVCYLLLIHILALLCHVSIPFENVQEMAEAGGSAYILLFLLQGDILLFFTIVIRRYAHLKGYLVTLLTALMTGLAGMYLILLYLS